MELNIENGATHTKNMVVTINDTALNYGSGMVEVFATPAMIALMENTSLRVVLPYLPEGYNTVGTKICVNHIKATPVGMNVRCNATLKEKDGRKLLFDVVAYDENGEIGNGTHTRLIIDTKKFMSKL